MDPRLARLLRPALLAVALGCHTGSDSARSDAAVAPLAASASPASVLPERAAPYPLDAAPAALDAVAVRARVDAFFAQFHDGTDFEFLRAACESPVERFVTTEHADIGAVITSSVRFFHAKRRLEYTPDGHALTTETLGDVTVARVPLTMTWATPPPAAWAWAADDAAAPDLDPLWAGLVVHQANVDVEIAFAPDGRIRRYVEGPAQHATLRATGADSCGDVFDGGPPITVLKKGARVVDLGDTFAPSIATKGPQIVRHVQRDGSELWVNDTRAFAVPNPNGGTSAGTASCLEPVAAPAPPKDGPLECRATSGGETVELFLTWERNIASGSLRTTHGDGGFATRAVKAELYKGLVLVNPASAPDPGSRIATVQEQGEETEKKMIQVGDWHQPWLPCVAP
jgi:hypothetical protein